MINDLQNKDIIDNSIKYSGKSENLNSDDVFHEVVFVDAKNAGEIRIKRELLGYMGYELIDHSLTYEDTIHLVFKRKENYKICECMFKKDNNTFNCGNCCIFHIGKYCAENSNRSHCPYIGTKENIEQIKKLVIMFENINKAEDDYYGKHGEYWVETNFGRVFTSSYNHLYEKYNAIDEKEK